VEVDIGSGDEVVDDAGHQNLAAEGLAGNACGVVDRGVEGFSVIATSEDPQTGLVKLVLRKALDRRS
jgi:hypothetical protein